MPLILIVGAVVIALGTGAYFITGSRSDVAATEPVTTRAEEVTATSLETPETAETEEIVVPETAIPEAGSTYNFIATYLTPKRDEHSVDVSLTITDGIVTGSVVTFDNLPVGEVSNPNQERFLAAYETEVIGKPISDINLSRVGGASLTTGAFNDAVAQIRLQAGV